MFLCLSEEGNTFVIQAGPECKLLGKNPLNEMCLASPAMARDKLLIRTMTQVYCLGKTGRDQGTNGQKK